MTSQIICITFLSWFILGCSSQSDSNSCSPTNGDKEVIIAVKESAAVGDVVYTAKIPGNSSSVSLTGENNKFFSFDPETRNITVSVVLDAEAKPDSQPLVISCQVLATGERWVISVYILISDANDHSPVFTKDIYNMSIGEMTDVNSIIQTGVTATDGDATPDFSIIYYSIVNGSYTDYFAIVNPLITELTLLKQLDYETQPQMTITIMAMDQPISGNVQFNATCTLVIQVEDEDDHSPVFNSSLYRGLITNTTAVGSVVPISPPIFAYDPDVTLHERIVYSFHGAEYHFTHGQTALSEFGDTAGQSNPIFTIDPNTAEVKLVSLPTAEEVYLLVQASQVDNPSRYGMVLLTIHIQGSNTNAPIFTRNSYQMVLPEVFPVGEVVTTVFAIDKDLDSTIIYSLNDTSKTFDIYPDSGDIVLTKELSYVLKDKYQLMVTASDGTLESKVTVIIQVRPVHNSPPQILNTSLNVTAERKRGEVIIDIDAKDSDEGTQLKYSLLSYNELFTISKEGIITIAADPSALVLNLYPVTVVVSHGGQPSYERAAVVLVNFPNISPVASAQIVEGDNVAVIVLAALAAFVLVIVIILVVYICRRRLRDKEHFDRVKKQHTSQDPMALTFKQKQGTQSVRQTNAHKENGLDNSDGYSNVQENPLNSDTKGGYYNFGIISNSDTETEIDLQEMQVESQFELHRSDSNNNSSNDQIYNTSQCSMDSDGYSLTNKKALTPFYRNGSASTYRDSSGSDVSFSGRPTAKSDTKKSLAPGPLARTRVPEENGGFWDRNENSLSSSAMPSLDPNSSASPPSQKQELTVYF